MYVLFKYHPVDKKTLTTIRELDYMLLA